MSRLCFIVLLDTSKWRANQEAFTFGQRYRMPSRDSEDAMFSSAFHFKCNRKGEH